MLLLALIATALGATSLAYNVLDDQQLALVGVLVTFALLVQFASFLADVERRISPGGDATPLNAFAVHSRRLVEVAVDFVLITGAFRAAYAVRFGWPGTVEPAPHRGGDAADPARGALPRIHAVRPLPLRLALRIEPRHRGNRRCGGRLRDRHARVSSR